MRTTILAVAALLSAGCVPDNEGTVTFNYLILHEDAPGVIAALLCDNPNINNSGSSFIKSQVAQIIITGTSRRGLVVQREAECFYDVPSGNIDSEQELGAFQAKFPADTYQSFKIQLLNAQGTPVVWALDPANNFVQENEVLGGLTINVEKEGEIDLGPTFEQLGQDGAVSQELTIFVQ